MNDKRVDVVALGREEAKAVGVLCGRARSSDVVDAHVALVARRLAGTVITSDRQDIARRRLTADRDHLTRSATCRR